MATRHRSFFGTWFGLFKQTFSEWSEDKAPQLGAALAYYTVFSLAPLILVLLAIVGLIFQNDPAGAWKKITEQMSYFLDKSAVEIVQNIAQKAAQPSKGTMATIIGIVLALFGASGVFGQLQDALNTIWGVKAKPGGFPHFAVDRYGLFINWEEFAIDKFGNPDGYIGTAIVAVSKDALINNGGGSAPRRVQRFGIPFQTGFEYRVWPAYIPPRQSPVLTNGGTEYFS
jgi:hypothetical protein